MGSPEISGMNDMKVDAANLYREEVVTDLRVATIRQLVPVKADGSPDPDRETIYYGQAQMLTSGGPLPIEARLDAKSLPEAIEKFPDAIRKAVSEVIEQVREYQRQAASRIVVPKTMPGGPGMPGGQGGPGGKIQLG